MFCCTVCVLCECSINQSTGSCMRKGLLANEYDKAFVWGDIIGNNWICKKGGTNNISNSNDNYCYKVL